MNTQLNNRLVFVAGLLILAAITRAQADDLGRLSANPFDADSIANPYGAGSPFKNDGVKNPYSQYGSPYSDDSATNPFATSPPELYDQEGNYRGKLSKNPFDAESIANPYGRYGSPYSPDSVNNPYGAGNPFDAGSPTNPFGSGWEIRPGND